MQQLTNFSALAIAALAAVLALVVALVWLTPGDQKVKLICS